MPQQSLARCGVRPPLAAVIAVAVLGLAVLLDCPAASGQEAIQAAIRRTGPVSPEERADLYRQLAGQAEILEQQSAVVKTVAKLIGPTVVHVAADVSPRITLHYGQGRHIEEAGSGVVVELDGKHYVLTNRHVVSGARPDGVTVTLADGRQIRPLKVWDDPTTDVAVMQVEAADLVAALVGDSDRMEIGDFVLAVGSPFGLSHSVTYGIISAKGRRDLELGSSGVRLQDFLQTDAAINPGNSGGPLINLRGEVIGINTAIASNSGGSEGIGFSIPIKMFMHVARQLIEKGKVARAFLGVKLDATFGAAMAAELGLPRPVGARITKIVGNSPAAAADLREGDVILQFNDIPVEDDNHLVNLVNFTDIGKKVALVVFRDRQALQLEVAVADSSQFPPEK
jgi:serine protease Do